MIQTSLQNSRCLAVFLFQDSLIYNITEERESTQSRLQVGAADRWVGVISGRKSRRRDAIPDPPDQWLCVAILTKTAPRIQTHTHMDMFLFSQEGVSLMKCQYGEDKKKKKTGGTSNGRDAQS